MLRDGIIEDIMSLSAEDFVSRHLFDRCPAIFEERDAYVKWKGSLSRDIEVDAASITIVGSSAIGVSLNPFKSFKLFDARSDIDIAVISGYHFQVAWRFLRSNGHIRFKLSHKQKAAWDEHVNKLIFWGTIATDKLLPLMPFATQWMQASNNASKNEVVADRSIKFRIYSDYDSLRAYQINSVKASRAAVLTSQV